MTCDHERRKERHPREHTVVHTSQTCSIPRWRMRTWLPNPKRLSLAHPVELLNSFRPDYPSPLQSLQREQMRRAAPPYFKRGRPSVLVCGSRPLSAPTTGGPRVCFAERVVLPIQLIRMLHGFPLTSSLRDKVGLLFHMDSGRVPGRHAASNRGRRAQRQHHHGSNQQQRVSGVTAVLSCCPWGEQQRAQWQHLRTYGGLLLSRVSHVKRAAHFQKSLHVAEQMKTN
jgi:hypothetical protein